MLSRNELKLIRSLHRRKERDKSQLFLAEGTKLVSDLIASGLEVVFALSTQEMDGYRVISEENMRDISLLDTPSPTFAVFKKRSHPVEDSNFILALDRVRDPGNLGTILRTADWFGIKKVYLSKESVEPYNPKVVQSSMGAIARVEVVEGVLPVDEWKGRGYAVLGTAMEGQSVMGTGFDWPEKTVLLMGNEGAGLDPAYLPQLNGLVSIPKAHNSQAESLNLSMATGIFLATYFQKQVSGGFSD